MFAYIGRRRNKNSFPNFSNLIKKNDDLNPLPSASQTIRRSKSATSSQTREAVTDLELYILIRLHISALPNWMNLGVIKHSQN